MSKDLSFFKNNLTQRNDKNQYNIDSKFDNINKMNEIQYSKKQFIAKKKLLNENKKQKNFNCYPYFLPDSEFGGLDIDSYEFHNLSLDFEKYFKYLPTNLKRVQCLFTPFSEQLRKILFGINRQSLYEIFTNNKSGFTFAIFNLLRELSENQPTFYFNYYQQYFCKYDTNVKVKMILNEFVRLANNYNIFNQLTKSFIRQVNDNAGSNEIFEINKFEDLIIIIEKCLKLLKNKQTIRFNIIIDDFKLDINNIQKYKSFKENVLCATKPESFYLFKFLCIKNDNEQEFMALKYFGKLIGYDCLKENYYYKMGQNAIYLPRNRFDRENNFHQGYEKLSKIFELLKFNFVDAFKFYEDIMLYINNMIDYDELESLIINRYRYEYSLNFDSVTCGEYLLSLFHKPLEEGVFSVEYKPQDYMRDLLLLPYIEIDFEKNQIYVLGPIYRKIVNKIIMEEKERIKITENEDLIQLGISIEKYIKLLFEYQSIGLYLDIDINKYYIYSKEANNSKSINWSFIKKKSLKNPKNVFFIDQKNKNGKFFDFLVLKCSNNNNIIKCILFFIQISVKKSIQQLKTILNNLFSTINEYKATIEENGLIFSDAFFYLISSNSYVDEKFINYCINRDLKINISFKDREKHFIYFDDSLYIKHPNIKKLPEIQNYQELLKNYIGHTIFDALPDDDFQFSDEELLSLSQCGNIPNDLNLKFDTKFINENFKKISKIKYIMDLQYNNKFCLKKNVLGIHQYFDFEKNPANKNNNKSHEVKLLGGENIVLVRKQIYWFKNKIMDENGKIINYDCDFHIFKISKKK